METTLSGSILRTCEICISYQGIFRTHSQLIFATEFRPNQIAAFCQFQWELGPFYFHINIHNNPHNNHHNLHNKLSSCRRDHTGWGQSSDRWIALVINGDDYKLLRRYNRPSLHTFFYCFFNCILWRGVTMERRQRNLALDVCGSEFEMLMRLGLIGIHVL